MKKITVFLLLAMLTLQARAQEYHYDVNNDGEVNVTDVLLVVDKILGKTPSNEVVTYPLNITVSENPLVSPDGTPAGIHRSPVVTTQSLNHFYISWMYNNPYDGRYEFPSDNNDNDIVFDTYRIGAQGATQSGYYKNNGYWPDLASGSQYGNNPLTVFGFNDGTFIKNGQTGKPYLQVGTDEASYNQSDLIVARNVQKWNDSHGGNVQLTFNHVCAAFQFFIQKTSSLASYEIQVSEIVLHNIKKMGHLDLMAGIDSETHEYTQNPWSEVEGYTYFTLAANANGNNYLTVTTEKEPLNQDNNIENNYMFIIPQTIDPMSKGASISDADGSHKSYLEIRCKIFNNNDYIVGHPQGNENEFESVYLPFNLSSTPQMGHIYPIVISMGTSLRNENGDKIFN